MPPTPAWYEDVFRRWKALPEPKVYDGAFQDAIRALWHDRPRLDEWLNEFSLHRNTAASIIAVAVTWWWSKGHEGIPSPAEVRALVEQV